MSQSEPSESVQSPRAIIMVRPHNFRPNPMTVDDNEFQQIAPTDHLQSIAKNAYAQVSNAAQIISDLGVKVYIFDDETTETPDSIFPNNWFSTHDDGRVALYPMYVPNRRKERRDDIIAMLKSDYHVVKLHDYSDLENQNIFLEGTGAMVLDHEHRIAYAARSNRAHDAAFQQYCDDFSYKPYMFDAHDKNGIAVYHTNVMMCVAGDYALIALDMITDKKQRDHVQKMLEQSGKYVIALREEQIFQFAGNAIELSGKGGKYLIMSQSSYESLDSDQISVIERFAKIQPIDVSTAEMAGGSIRCMIAGIHLTPR